MENVKYFYQFSLANGKVVIQEIDGLFCNFKDENGDESSVMINSAALIQTVSKRDDEVKQEEVEAELVS